MNMLYAEYFKDKNLLILTPSYPDRDASFMAELFVLNQVAELKNYFKKIFIIAPVLETFGFSMKDKKCKNYSYDNVDVFFPRCIYLPVFWVSKILIDNRLSVVEKTLEKYNLHFDLIHAHFTWPSGYIGTRLKEKYGKPVVITIHENETWFNQEIAMNHPLINDAWSKADAIIRVNKKDIPMLKRYNDHVYAIPNGYSTNFYPVETALARQQLGLQEDSKIIFSLGYLIKRKGFNYLVDAMKQICRQRNDVFCYIGGEGPERQYLLDQIQKANLSGKVHLLGSVRNDLVRFWMNSCDLFILPSMSEGNPTVMFEALGCGKPYIGTDVGGVSEIIVSEDYGLLVTPGDADDLSKKIQHALGKIWIREEILQYAEQYTWENVVRQIVDIYNRVEKPEIPKER